MTIGKVLKKSMRKKTEWLYIGGTILFHKNSSTTRSASELFFHKSHWIFNFNFFPYTQWQRKLVCKPHLECWKLQRQTFMNQFLASGNGVPSMVSQEMHFWGPSYRRMRLSGKIHWGGNQGLPTDFYCLSSTHPVYKSSLVFIKPRRTMVQKFCAICSVHAKA